MDVNAVLSFFIALARDMLLAAVPAVGFALVFNVPVRALRYCAILGALGHGLRFVLLACGLPLVISTFFGALGIGFAGIYFSRRFLAHPKVFTVAALIPMVPGVMAYKAVISLVRLHTEGYNEILMGAAVSSFLNTLAIVAALTLGLALPGMIFYRRRPIV